MAITDGTFDAAEFEAAVTANPALLDQVRPGLTKLGVRPYTQQEYDTDLNTKIGEKTKEIHSAYEKDALELTGIPKQGNEKAYVYLKRAVGSVLTTRQSKIAELETAIATGGGDATLKAQLDQLKEKETQYQTDIKDRDTKLFQKDVALDIRDGLRGLKFDGTVKESLRNMAIKTATANVLALATLEKDAAGNENIRYVRDGKVILDGEGRPATAAFVLTQEAELKDVLDLGQPGAGGGAGGGQGNGKGGKVTIPETVPADVKTQAQLIDYLLKLGVAQETEEFDTAFEKLSKGLKFR